MSDSESKAEKKVSLEDIAALCKRRGFIYQGSEIYGGLSGTWDYGPLGVQLKRNITSLWWKTFVEDREDVYGIDAAILMNPKVWEASGHVSGFNDPLVEDLKTKKRYRADHLLEDAGVEGVSKMTPEQMDKAIKKHKVKSPEGNDVSDVRQFNMMFKSSIGANSDSEDETSVVYLRPETAAGMFMNYKNVVDSFSPDIPFALAQIGKAFRNEISPRDFIFRVRELEQMEIELFVHPDSWKENFDKWLQMQQDFFLSLGLPADKLHQIEVPAEDRAHYSKHSIDTEFDFPFGQKELAGCAYRTDHDLGSHGKASGKNLVYRPKDGGEPFVPHVVEPTFGLDRTLLAVLANSYTEDEVNGEKRIYLKLPANLAPVKVAVSPLLKNKPELVDKAREVYMLLKKELGNVMWDDNGNIGKRYRRQDEIGTPYCVVVDFETLEGDTAGTVTVRDRDTTEQKRVKIEDLLTELALATA
jgi:glycyl-tRNA synthetase